MGTLSKRSFTNSVLSTGDTPHAVMGHGRHKTLLPRVLQPLDDIFMKTIQTTQIKPAKFKQPNFAAPEDFLASLPPPPPFITLPFPLQYPPPDGPIRLVFEHPIFGLIESPVYVPCIIKKITKKKKSRGARRREIKRKSMKRKNETNISTSQAVESLSSELVDFHKSNFVEEYAQKITEHSLNQYLIYFKCVEKSVKSSLDKSASQSPDSAKIKDLLLLTELLSGLIESVENFYEENHESFSEIENSVHYQEIRNSVLKLQSVLDELNAANISELLCQNIDKKEEHMLCSILGLEDEIAEYLLNLDPNVRNHQTDQHWILQFFEHKEESLENGLDIKTILKALGFNASKTKHLADKLSKNDFTDHQT